MSNCVPLKITRLEGMKFGQLILRRIVKIVATKCQILRLKCAKTDFGWGSAPDPTGGAYSAPQTTSWIWGRGGAGLGKRRERVRGRGGRGSGGEGKGGPLGALQRHCTVSIANIDS